MRKASKRSDVIKQSIIVRHLRHYSSCLAVLSTFYVFPVQCVIKINRSLAVYGTSLPYHFSELLSISSNFLSSLPISNFRLVAYPASTGHLRSVASGRPYQRRALKPAFAFLKLFHICPFQLSSNKTNLVRPCSLTNGRSVLSHQRLQTCWFNQVCDWK